MTIETLGGGSALIAGTRQFEHNLVAPKRWQAPGQPGQDLILKFFRSPQSEFGNRWDRRPGASEQLRPTRLPDVVAEIRNGEPPNVTGVEKPRGSRGKSATQDRRPGGKAANIGHA